MCRSRSRLTYIMLACVGVELACLQLKKVSARLKKTIIVCNSFFVFRKKNSMKRKLYYTFLYLAQKTLL